MNRPNFENYKWKYTTQWKYDVAGYRANVEKYCDELEKALDKACSKLEEINICPHMTKKEYLQWSKK